jgi:hypothetical protein
MGTNLQSVLCVSRLARPTMAAGAAIVAGAIAVVTAIEAWFSLQSAAGLTGTHPQPPPEAVLGILLPLLIIGFGIGLTWLTRYVGRERPGHHETVRGAKPTDSGQDSRTDERGPEFLR